VSQPPPPPPGAAPHPDGVIGGRYRLTRHIATGGMAEVWEAHDPVLDRRVAVKILQPHLASDPVFRERFRGEAIAAARLVHPSIVGIYDTCTDGTSEAIVMELVNGRTLRQVLDDRGPLNPSEVVRIGAEVAAALDVAHRAGIVHRDIKPANILVGDDQRVLVADFGIAKAQDRADMTNTGTMLGTVKYLAPEQVEGIALDGRADIFSLGVVLYEALTGRVPFQAETDAATALARLHRTPVPPHQLRAGVPRGLEQVILRAMARDRDQRHPTAADLRAALLSSPKVTTDADHTRADVTRAVAYAPPAADTVVPTFSQTERRWLLPTFLIALTAAALAVAGVLFGRTEAGQDLFRRVGEAVGVQDPEPSGPPPTVTGAFAFDPFGGDGENDGQAALVIDDDPTTAWRSEGYQQRDLRGKPGIGVYLTLDHADALDRLEVVSPTIGWSAAVYVADTPAADLAGWGEPISQADLIQGNVELDLHEASGGAVLLWITDPGDGPAPFRIEIGELTVYR
jgi:serine/threonine-protein kinase